MNMSSVVSGDQPTTQAIEPTGSDPKASGPSIVIETVEPQVAMPEVSSSASEEHQLEGLPHLSTRLESSGAETAPSTPACHSIIRSITEFVDRYEEATAERDQLRRDLEQSQQELRSAQDLLSQANSLKDAVELQSKSLEKKLADLARESAKKMEAEKCLAQEASDALLAKEAETEKTRAVRLQEVVGPLAGLLSLSGILTSSENSLDKVIYIVASVSSGAATGIQQACSGRCFLTSRCRSR
ncbi:uncharacterized protein LOC104581541 isoform X2 [Brachypodium distachyon]|uniref:uncharacterized protein LOC104581541 isoform X2 n=1 Tax=Brachypodium distachyon TaxID=15368 RepID=UPI000D0E1B6B|nr:uncharacterized protein LOC104581541 isoform X2 [Brachypodium distachyon]XP_024313828.1 uncharacterized protein LOC104581541 isoform X2 [Brachypodium distachyon]|eukprot:XP_024313827.1 uncharacterized protein LOC104581541 isoform X2 [Brachypodium distachyon]